MAIKKKRGRKAAPPPTKRGRKKELKRFEMETWTHEDMRPDPVSGRATAPNEVAFVVRTSGGTPLNATDVKKLFGVLQHELRSLGHHLKRKGQPLDPEPKQPKTKKGGEPEAPTNDALAEAASEGDNSSDEAPENTDHANTDTDPDNPDPETHTTA